MVIIACIIFAIGLLLFITEQSTHINKTVTAMGMGSLIVGCALYMHPEHLVKEFNIFGWEIAKNLFFLLEIMVLVELVAHFGGFNPLISMMRSQTTSLFIWKTSILTFFLSAVLDNVATTIVMCYIMNHSVQGDSGQLKALAVNQANAGGAWSPIGDFTTTMLWNAGLVSTIGVIKGAFLPSITYMIVYTLLLLWTTKPIEFTDGEVIEENFEGTENHQKEKHPWHSFVMGVVGISCLLLVPVIKHYSNLPPMFAAMVSLFLVWAIAEALNARKDGEERRKTSVAYALRQVEYSTILFFLGLLLAVGGLESLGVMKYLATALSTYVPNVYIQAAISGIASAIIDNVALVAAFVGMYSKTYGIDHMFWYNTAYVAGVGGSILITGSAAGVVVMEKEQITFVWWVWHIAWKALLSLVSGIVVVWVFNNFYGKKSLVYSLNLSLSLGRRKIFLSNHNVSILRKVS